MTTVGLIETTLRDGQQSLWATRMTTAMMLPALPLMDGAGFRSIETMSGVHFDVCVRYLRENPWERMRLVRDQVRRTPLRMLAMSQFFSISRVLPNDVVELFTRTCADHGIDEFWVTASMNDVRTAEVTVRTARALGRRIEGGIQYTVSPVHTDEFFVDTARQFVAMGVDGLVLKDAGGLLTPERARHLIPKLVDAGQGVPLYCHSHAVTGMGPAANLEAVQAGASAIWTCAMPLANGSSHIATESAVKHLGWLGYETGVDREAVEAISTHFQRVARDHDMPVGRPAEYDPAYYEHQMPGGMISNFRSQLRQLELEDRLGEVLEEMPRVREDLGWPNIQTPYSQFVGTQALLNVLYGRYEVVPDEVRRLALGYWGRTPAPIQPDVLDRLGEGQPPVTERPGELVPPIVDRFRREHGPFRSDADLLLAILFMSETLKPMYEAGPIQTAHAGWLVGAVREAARTSRVRKLWLSVPK